MTYYAVAKVTVTDDSWVEAYLPVVTALVEKHGGKYLARTMTMDQLEGDQEPPDVFVIVEFPSKDLAKAFYDDPEYSPFLKNRLAGSKSEFTLVAGEDMVTD